MSTIDFDELRGQIRGDVLTSDDDRWTEVLVGHNTAVVHEPAAIMDAADVDDLVSAVAFAAGHDLQVAVQATGHGPSHLLRGGLLIRTGRLTAIEVDADARTVRVEPGVVWGELMAACAEQGLAPLGMASVASVGVVGYTVGGGIGPFGRAQGFGADHVRAVEVVTADGQVRTVDADHDVDLFWAVRGGRLGFGVIASMTLELVAAPTLAAAALTFAREHVAEALTAYATWQEGLDEQTSTVASLMRFPDVEQLPENLRGQRFLQVDVVRLGDESDLHDALGPLVTKVAPTTRNDLTGDASEWLHAQPPVPVGPSWQRAVVIDRLDGDAVGRVLDTIGLDVDAPWQVTEIRPFGGALARPAKEDNAVGVRPGGVLVNTVAAGDPSQFGELPAAHADLVRSLGEHVRTELPVNFLAVAADGHPLSAAWDIATLDRLRSVRRGADPNGVFELE